MTIDLTKAPHLAPTRIAEPGDPCPPVDLTPVMEWCAEHDREHQPRERPAYCWRCGVMTVRSCCLARSPRSASESPSGRVP